MTSRQMVMDLPVRTALGRDSFFVAQSNALALAKIDAWQDWAGGKLALIGPEGSGKSHLVAVWAEMSGATILDLAQLDRRTSGHVAIEDADRIAGNKEAEEALFHLHNRVLGAGSALLLTGRDVPERWGITLPDLGSRILAADIAKLGAPDDTVLAAVLIKLFDDRQLNVAPDVITYLTTRIDRSFAQAERIVARLDQVSMRERRKINLRFVRDVLKDAA